MEDNISKQSRPLLRLFLGIVAVLIFPILGLVSGILLDIIGVFSGIFICAGISCVAALMVFIGLTRQIIDFKAHKNLLFSYCFFLGFIVIARFFKLNNAISWTPFLVYYFAVPLKLTALAARRIHEERRIRDNAENAEHLSDEIQELESLIESQKRGRFSSGTSGKGEKRAVQMLLILFVCGALFLGVNFLQMGFEDNPNAPQEAQETQGALSTTCTVGNVTFEVQPDWEPLEGAKGMYITKDKKIIYGLQGVTPLGSYTPKEFFAALKEYYAESYQLAEFTSYTVAQGNLSGGVIYYEGDIRMIDSKGIFYEIAVLIVPDKNLALTFCGQANQRDSMLVDTQKLWRTTTFQIGDQDYISGNTFLNEDGSELCLQQNGAFCYYQSQEDHENLYYAGMYEVFYGQPAFEKIAAMTEYGLTMEELQQTLSVNMSGYTPGGSSPLDYLYALQPETERDTPTQYHVCKDTFYAVILHNDKLVTSPSIEEKMHHDTLYIGYYIPELNIADMTNANAQTHLVWQYKGKTDR